MVVGQEEINGMDRIIVNICRVICRMMFIPPFGGVFLSLSLVEFLINDSF